MKAAMMMRTVAMTIRRQVAGRRVRNSVAAWSGFAIQIEHGDMKKKKKKKMKIEEQALFQFLFRSASYSFGTFNKLIWRVYQ
jgi:hypothetical protein